MTDTVKAPRSELATWTKKQIDGQAEISIPALTDQAMKAFDAAKLAEMFHGQLRGLVYEFIRVTVSNTRSLVLLGDTATNREGVTARSLEVRNVWSTWLEHAGDRSVRLLDMRKADLLSAAEERERRGTYELEVAGLWRGLAAKLKGDERVRDRFTAEQIEAVRASLRDQQQRREGAA